jgi:hypothetical protein
VAFDYKFKVAGQFDKAYQNLTWKNGSPKISKVVETYKQNMDRVALHWALPLHFFALGQLARDTYLNVGTRIFTPTYAEETRVICDSKEQAGGDDEPKEYRLLFGDLLDQSQMETSADIIFDMRTLMLFHERWSGLFDGVESVLTSMVVGAWTAFETLAGDLWIEAVNEFPSELAPLTGSPDRIHNYNPVASFTDNTDIEKGGSSKPEEEEDHAAVRSSGKKIPLSDLHKLTRGSYEISDKMGELLLFSGHVQFKTLTDIRLAYSLAFSEKYKKARPYGIDESLANKGLDALSKVRNLLVHRSGVADRQYLRETKHLDLAPKLEITKRLVLDGEVTKKLIDTSVHSACKLIGAIDAWTKIVVMSIKNKDEQAILQ